MRGLKSKPIEAYYRVELVAPFTGAWIEMQCCLNSQFSRVIVAPFTGAWIEIITSKSIIYINQVAPFTGAWIEIIPDKSKLLEGASRTFHRCED